MRTKHNKKFHENHEMEREATNQETDKSGLG